MRRSSRSDVRNPLVALPAFRALAGLPEPARSVLHRLLLDLRDDARARAAMCWTKRKPPMAAYWAAVGVYAGHAARALGRPAMERGGGHAVRSPDGPDDPNAQEQRPCPPAPSPPRARSLPMPRWER